MTNRICKSACHCKRSPVLNWLLKRKLRKLKLGERQIEQLDQLILSTASARHDNLSARGELHSSLAELLIEPVFNRDKAAEVMRTATGHQVDRATKLIDTFGEFYDGLDSRQQAQLRAMWQKRGRCTVRCCY